MNDNKLVTGGFVFALTSLVTYSYHILNDKSKYKLRQNRQLETIIEDIIGENEISQKKNTTPNNTPESEKNLSNDFKTNNIKTYNEKSSPLQKLKDDKIDILVKDMKILAEEKINSGTHSMSSFLELYNTGSQTDTEELEFTKLDHYRGQEIYGTPIITTLTHSADFKCESDESSEVEISYYSETEILKPSSKRKLLDRVKSLLQKKIVR